MGNDFRQNQKIKKGIGMYFLSISNFNNDSKINITVILNYIHLFLLNQQFAINYNLILKKSISPFIQKKLNKAIFQK
jgi:hypothetical protein